MSFWSTRQVARMLGVTPALMTKALWDGRVPAPQKSPSGNFLWTAADIDRASWALLRRGFEMNQREVAR
ncbi:MAG: hypothetical protein QM570_20310 [Planctomycetota bacterium]|nr:hypothetical protein [Planctomycetota bacterium]